jgi:predicted DNA-binding transcriptional regulator YafY
MNKFDRVFSTLILLQSKKLLKARTIAERFEISLRTVYRDINTLKNAGIPIIGDPGIGYSIMEGYRLPPIMFSKGEAAALITAEKFMGKVTDKETQAYYSNAMVKIKAILRNTEKQTVEVLDNAIAISDKTTTHKTYLQDLFACLAAKQVLQIQYQKADGTTSNRNLEPIGCYNSYNNWYLVAFCQLKKAYRTFKMNRIVHLQILEEYFQTKHISLPDYMQQQSTSWKKDHQLQTIEIEFKHRFIEHAERRKYYFGFVKESKTANATQMTFLNSSIEIFARWLLQFGNQATVISPVLLRDRLKELSTQLYEHYQ